MANKMGDINMDATCLKKCNDYLEREYITGEIPAWKRHAAQVADDIVYAHDKYRETEGINDKLWLILLMMK